MLNRELFFPEGQIDVVLDTDAFNEVDDQFAIAYLLRSTEKLHTQAFYAAPFLNEKVSTPKEGMEKSFEEIKHIIALTGEKRYPVFLGSEGYLPDEKTAVESAAARDLAERAMQYTEEYPLYVVAIGAITNVASAILLNPAICDRIVCIWLGGNARDYLHTKEFNLRQDIAAARIVMSQCKYFVQLPCMGVVSSFRASKADIKEDVLGKNPLCDYLGEILIERCDRMAKSFVWSKPIWDVTAVGWLLNADERMMKYQVTKTYLPNYEGQYEAQPLEKEMIYVTFINRDLLYNDLLWKLGALTEKADPSSYRGL